MGGKYVHKVKTVFLIFEWLKNMYWIKESNIPFNLKGLLGESALDGPYFFFKMDYKYC